jgi:universal stress protein A
MRKLIMAYENILIAVDLTDEATEVLAAAKKIAEQQESAKLSAVTVIRPLSHSYGGLDMTGFAAAAPIETQMRDQAIEKLAALGEEYGVSKANRFVRTGQPAAEIRALAEEVGADLIVIGTHGRHGLGLLLGSTVNAVLHGVPCDVLTIKIHPLED